MRLRRHDSHAKLNDHEFDKLNASIFVFRSTSLMLKYSLSVIYVGCSVFLFVVI